LFVVLTTADTEIQALAAALRRVPDDFAVVRARNANEFQSAEALDRFVAEELPKARALIVRILGGRPYFADGFERLSRECKARGIAFFALPATRPLTPNSRLSATPPCLW